jgi:protein-S-isoprenylcysteine O-methyltransferase Ste14
VGIVFQLTTPWNLPGPAWAHHAVGCPLVAAGVALAVWAVAAAGAVDLAAPNRVVAGGPYAHSRNPMYVAWTFVYVGVSLVLGSAWPLVLLPAVLAITHREVLREERRLAASLGPEFTQYRETVRRYL